MSTIRRKRPEHIQKEEIRPWSFHRTPSWKGMLNWTLFKSSRVNLQDNRTRHQNLAKQYTWRGKSAALRLTELNFYCLNTVNNKRKCWPETKYSGLKDKTDRLPKQKLKLLKSSRVNLQDNRTRHQNLAEQYTWRGKSVALSLTELNLYCLTADENKRKWGTQQ